MEIYQSICRGASLALHVYAAYVGVSMLAFGAYLWQSVYHQDL